MLSPVDEPRPPFMERAAALALSAVRQGTGGPFGAVVVHRGRILGEGQNRVLERTDPTAHAELEAIRAACAARGSFHLEGCELYASCEPCPMCLAAARWARLAGVWYAGTREDAARAGFDDARFHGELARSGGSSGEGALPLRPFLPQAAREAFEAWGAKGDRTVY